MEKRCRGSEFGYLQGPVVMSFADKQGGIGRGGGNVG